MRDEAAKFVGKIGRSEVSAAVCQQLSAMLSERGWQTSDAETAELARMLADCFRLNGSLREDGNGSRP